MNIKDQKISLDVLVTEESLANVTYATNLLVNYGVDLSIDCGDIYLDDEISYHAETYGELDNVLSLIIKLTEHFFEKE